MFQVEYPQVKVIKKEHLKEKMASSKVCCRDAIIHINLQFCDRIKQGLQHILAPIELGYLFGISNGAPGIDALVVMFRRRI